MTAGFGVDRTESAGGAGSASTIDHGVLLGLSDDDHTQYLLASAATSRALFATNWTDLTDGGGTTLHTHAHSAITGLTSGDDHTQYALLAGRASGQILNGGTAASETLKLRGTAHATVGIVALNDLGGHVTVGGGTSASELRFLEPSGSGANYTAFKAQAQTSDVTYTLPAADATVSGQFLSSNASGTLSWTTAGSLTLGTEQASTSGTTIDFTGIPAGTKLIIINISGVSWATADQPAVQIGDSGGIETTGYTTNTAQVSNAGSTATDTATGSFRVIGSATAATTWSGKWILTLEDSADNTWIAQAMLYRSDAATVEMSVGIKSLSATLDRIRFTGSTGNTFDAGAVNIIYG